MRRARDKGMGGLLGLVGAVVEDVQIGDEEAIVVAARPGWRERDRCGICRRRSPGFDFGDGRRRWRALDLGATLAFIEADAPRVTCRRHGVVVCAVPWARHGSRFTRAFEDQAAWLAVNTSKTAVAQLMRVAWRTVGAICERVCDEAQREVDLLAGLRRIGIDEISHRKGQRYLTVVVDHDSGRLVWAAGGRDRKTVERFLDQLGQERCRQLELVSADMAAWVAGPIGERCPQAELCLDPFHIVMLATDALDEVRREVWNEARRAGQTALARDLKGARFALWKNPENLTGRQQAKLSTIQHTNRRLYRAYLLKEQLRQIYRLPADVAVALLDGWIAWASRCRLASFVKLARTITAQRTGIVAAIKHGLSNARVEAINTQIRLITRRAFGFHSPDPLIALAMLSLADLCPSLPR
jgi:transposase